MKVMSRPALCAIALGLFVPGCGALPREPAQPEVPTIFVTARDAGFDFPEEIPAGTTRIALINAGHEPHQLQLIQLADGHTADQLKGVAGAGPFPEWAIPVGGPNAVEPGDTLATIQALEAGRYAALCLIPSGDHGAYFTRGMLQEFEAVASSESAAVAAPAPDLYLELVDSAFALNAVEAGRYLVGVENGGQEDHGLAIARFNQGMTLSDYLGWAAVQGGAAPVRFVGGVTELAPGRQSIIELQLTPGRYLMLCSLPEMGSSKPYCAQGVIREFSVSPS